MKNKTNLPKWFKGTIYEEGDTVTNPFSGEEYKLTGLELSMYDFIIGCQMMFEIAPNVSNESINDFHKAINWFRTHNGKAYMVLLD